MTRRFGISTLVLGLAGVAMLAGTPSSAAGQYFGRNKVQYQSFDFQVLKTEHFDIYHYPEEREAAVLAGRMAERWHSRLSRLLNHELSSRQPLIMYANHPHFEQTNALSGELGESTGGVTEVFKRRMVLPFAGSLRETDHVLGHELVHAFQFDITGEGRSVQTGAIPGALRLPLWFIEGMAEYLSVGPEDPLTAMWMRDAARRKLPSIREMGDPYRWFPYRFGQAFWSFVAGRYGDEVVGRLLKTAGRSADPEVALAGLLGSTPDELGTAWHNAIHEYYDPLVELTSGPGDYGEELFADGPAGTTSVAPALSPDGRYLAFISARDLFSIDVFLGDIQTGEVKSKITRTAVDPHFESLQFINSAGAWSPDAQQFAVAGISRGKPVITLIEVESGKTARDIRFPELGEIYNPSWSPDGRHMVFSAIRGGLSDLFVYDLEAGSLRRLTNDPYADLQPSWAPDGSSIVFVTDRYTTDLDYLDYGDYQLATIDPTTSAINPVAGFESGYHTSPQWAPDGQSLLFLSNQSGINNLYRLTLASGEIAQITNLYTGIAGITPLSPAMSAASNADRVVVSVYAEDGYHLYSLTPEALQGTEVIADYATIRPAVLPPAERISDDVVTVLADIRTGLADSLEFSTEPYSSRLALDYVAQPSLVLASDQFGTFFGGGAALYWSDMLGNRNLTTALQVNGGLKDVGGILGYTNMRRRLNWGVFLQQVPYVTGYVQQGFGQFGGQTVLIEQLFKFRQTSRDISGFISYPFNRVHRIQLTGGVRDIRFEQEFRTTYIGLDGTKLLDSTESFAPFPGIQLASASAALVYDNALIGATSPVLGQRYRLEVSPVLGNVSYLNLLGDFRRYVVPFRPVTVAARLFHFGRYGRGADDSRLQPLFIGYPGYVRGYDDNSFQGSDCADATADDPCPIFSRLFGSRMAMANLEVRFPLLGALGVGSGFYGFLPIELAIFGDAGMAWSADDGFTLTRLPTATNEQAFFFGGDRKPVYSAGAALRANVLGFAVIEFNYAYAFQRDKWVWQFGFVPGF